MSVTLAEAEVIADGTLAAGRSKGAQPLTVVVLDAGGHIVVVKRADDSGIVRVEIAFGDRALKGAMKGADKSGAPYVIVLGDSEISSGTVELKEMKSGGSTSVKIDSLLEALEK